MQVSAKITFIRITPQKARLVADQIRGKAVGQALEILTFSQKKAAHILKKVLESAIANAEHNKGADIDELKISNHLPIYAALDKRAKVGRDKFGKMLADAGLTPREHPIPQ